MTDGASAPIRVGVAGTGFSASVHLDALRRVPGVEVVAISGTDAERVRALASREGIARAYADHAELLEHPGLDAVHNCTINHLHHEVSLGALERGLHVLSEKPLATCRSQSAELAAAAAIAGVVAAVCFNYRHYPMVADLRARLASGDYGAAHFVHGAYLQDWLLLPTDWNWRLDPAEGGASRAVADIGSHWLDLAQYVTGDRIVEVCADLSTLHHARLRPARQGATFERADGDGILTPVETEDFGSVLLRFAGGARGSLAVSQVSAGRKNALAIEVDAAGGALAWRQEQPNSAWIGRRDEPSLELTRDPGALHPSASRLTKLPVGHPEGWLDALAALVGDFHRAVGAARRGEHATVDLASFEDGHAIVSLVDAIVDSHRERRWISVPAPHEVTA